MHKYSLCVAVLVMAIAVTALPGSGLAQDVSTVDGSTVTAPAASRPQQAGSAVLAVGTVTDTAADGGRRQLHDGDPIYSGDAISTGDDSYADLNFEDGGRMLLRPATDFQIQQYQYDPAGHGYALAPPAEPKAYGQTAPAAPAPANVSPQPVAAALPAAAAPEHESAFFRLIKGGFSAISGFIGHVEHQDYAVETPVATIGIRGTGYEVRYCDSGCPQGQRGLYTGVGKGIIAVRNQAGESLASAGHFGYVANHTSGLRRLAHAPAALRHMRLPSRFRARDARNFRRLQAQRRRHWQRTRRYRQQLHNSRGVHPQHPPHPAASAMGAQKSAHPRAKKKKKHPPHRHGPGR